MFEINIISVTPENVAEHGLWCIKDRKAAGYQEKLAWFNTQFEKGLRIKIAENDGGVKIGFIEYTPAEQAWRPVDAPGYFFIHCMWVYPNNNRSQGVATQLIEHCEQDARQSKKNGVCSFSSNGPWMKSKKIFLKLGYSEAAKLGRFELMVKKLATKAKDPAIIDWRQQQNNYDGWHLLYAHQCPWHEKSVQAMQSTAKAHGIKLNITRLNTPQDAQRAPSGFGVFSLLKDGKLLEDHYLSKTRFESIIKKELN